MNRQGIVNSVLLVFMVSLSPAVASAYEPMTGFSGGTIRGTIRFLGETPPAEKIAITRDVAYCGKVTQTRRSVITSPKRGLKDVVVFLKGVHRGKPIRPGVARIDNTKCRFAPHVQALVVGTLLKVRNLDPLLHNTHARKGRTDVFNFGLPEQGQVVEERITKKGLIKVGCDAGHTWMRAFIVAFDHPYFAVTGADGGFTLADVPPGTYTLTIWHEKLGSKKTTVTVPPGGVVDGSFELR